MTATRPPGLPPGRGGPQEIPRPEGWRLGAPPPWAGLDDRTLSLDGLQEVFDGRRPTGIRGTPTGREWEAGVLVALFDDPEGTGPHVVLTRRSPRRASHTHEVSFPGGRHDPDDADLWATALREAKEEIGLDPSLPRLLGRLDPVVTVGSGSLIQPFVAVLGRSPELEPNPDEVEAVRIVALSELVRDEVYREELWPRAEGPWSITFFELEGDTVWGATAAMLRQLLALALGAEDETDHHGGYRAGDA